MVVYVIDAAYAVPHRLITVCCALCFALCVFSPLPFSLFPILFLFLVALRLSISFLCQEDDDAFILLDYAFGGLEKHAFIPC